MENIILANIFNISDYRAISSFIKSALFLKVYETFNIGNKVNVKIV